jgi:diguanylate cyclase (GGDEF)-like protein
LDACSLLVMPILVQGQPRAILFLENRLSRGAFSADRLDTVNLIAGQLAVSLDNALLYASTERKVAERTEALAAANARLELLSVTDPLTGAANRRRFADHLQVEWRRAERNRTPLAIAMIDIDQFKPYNDYYGHPGGDACLSRIATVLRGAVRSSDLVARYGGEEFAIVLAETDLAAAQVVTERVRVAVEALDEPHAKSALGHVTISVGVAAHLPHTGGQPEKLVEAADIELYKAKRHGRNIVWPPTIPRRAT